MIPYPHPLAWEDKHFLGSHIMTAHNAGQKRIAQTLAIFLPCHVQHWASTQVSCACFTVAKGKVKLPSCFRKAEAVTGHRGAGVN